MGRLGRDAGRQPGHRPGAAGQAAAAKIILEVEITPTGGEEDGVTHEINDELYTTVDDALRTAEALGLGEKGRYLLAASFGNVHGVYKPGNVVLRPELLKDLQEASAPSTARPPPFDFVFHGGSGSTAEEIATALENGVVKMNLDTDTQYAFTRPVADHMFRNYDGVLKVDGEVGNKKTYDPPHLGGQGRRGRHGQARHGGVRQPALHRHQAEVIPYGCAAWARHPSGGSRAHGMSRP